MAFTITVVGIKVLSARLSKDADDKWQMAIEGNEIDSKGEIVRPVNQFATLAPAAQKIAQKLIDAQLRTFEQQRGITKPPVRTAKAAKKKAVSKKAQGAKNATA